MKRQLGQTRVKFTHAMWRKWWTDRAPETSSAELREGIQLMRALLQRREMRVSDCERDALYPRMPK